MTLRDFAYHALNRLEDVLVGEDGYPRGEALRRQVLESVIDLRQGVDVDVPVTPPKPVNFVLVLPSEPAAWTPTHGHGLASVEREAYVIGGRYSTSKILAIKALREREVLSLPEAKERVESLPRVTVQGLVQAPPF